MSAPITSDPKALHAYLVRLAMEAYVDTDNRRPGEYPREAMERRIRERMAQAAQTIVAEVAVLQESADARGYLDGLDEQRVTS